MASLMNGIITTCVGGFGRFGNQLFQYCVARAYAESIGAQLMTPNWVGRELFEDINEPIVSNLNLPIADGENLDGRTNVHLQGYFQRKDHLALLSRSKVKEWLKPKEKYRVKGHDLVFHKRRGDYITAGCYALVSDKSYEQAAISRGYYPSTAVVFDDSRSPDLQYSDFFEIMHSKVIFRANSTYSFWAGVLSDAKVFSPVVGDKTGWGDFEFVEGNHPKCFYMFDDFHIKD